jgi:hypothetical protein
VLAALSRRRSRVQVPSGPQKVTRPGSSVGTSVRLKIGRSAVRPRPWPPSLSPGFEHRPPAETHGGRFAVRRLSDVSKLTSDDRDFPMIAVLSCTFAARRSTPPKPSRPPSTHPSGSGPGPGTPRWSALPDERPWRLDQARSATSGATVDGMAASAIPEAREALPEAPERSWAVAGVAARRLMPAGGRQQAERDRPAPRLRGALIQKRSIRQCGTVSWRRSSPSSHSSSQLLAPPACPG